MKLARNGMTYSETVTNGIAMRQGYALWFGALVLIRALGAGEGLAAEIGPTDFAPAVFDAVAPGAEGQGLRDYRFIAHRDWPAIRLFAARPLDWSKFGTLALPVENPDDTPFRLLLRIDDRADANGDDRSLTGTIDIPPHAKGTVALSLDAGPIGMVARPPGEGAVLPGDLPVRQVRGAVDLTHVTALHISGVRLEGEQSMRLGNPTLRVAAPHGVGPVADTFGQAIEGQWPEKVASVADLRTKLHQAGEETTRLARDVPTLADRFGGVDPDTKLVATGFFRVEKTGDRWSLVTPAGHRFFSLGVDSVAPSNPTIVEGRRGLFADLPARRDPLARYTVSREGEGGPSAYDVGEADLDRGLGSGWRPLWRARTLRRLRAWSFNTLGNWSTAEVTAGGAMPFVEFDDVEGESAHVTMPGGRSLPDPFDPRFAGVADAVAARMTRPLRDDAMLLGYFSGNELPWGTDERPELGFAAQILALGADSPAKRAMIEGLRRRYGSATALAAAWGLPSMQAWDDLLIHPVPLPTILTDGARRDVGDFQRQFATLYFSTVAQALKRHDPHHLYLGTRFADAPQAVVEACARWCDVLSFNVYDHTPADRAAAWRSFDRPVLIGEFHFGSTDRGSFWPGMIDVGGEAARGPAYETYVFAALQDPNIIGCHWYQYADEPLTGRPYDGENGHIGLVAVTDVPYAGFVADVASANRRTMDRFAAQGRPDLRGTQ